MKQHILFLALLSSWLLNPARSQDTPLPVQETVKVYRVGIFASLFLDSTFSGTTYRYGNQMPRHLLPGLDFIDGALLALDTLTGTPPVQVRVFDLRSKATSFETLLGQRVFDSLDLMIGAVSGLDYRDLTDIAYRKKIPFVSTTFPNDGGITSNPYTIILNSTLPVHCAAIYNYVLETNGTANILYVRKQGAQEDRLAGYFRELNQSPSGNGVLRWKTISVRDTVSSNDLLPHLDSNRTNILIAGSLDERFGVQLIRTIAPYKKYPLQLVGMPTWEAMKELNLPEWKDLDFYFTTTFYNSGEGAAEQFSNRFTERTNGRPSDLAFRGYEAAWQFIRLLQQYGADLLNHLPRNGPELFTGYRILPVRNAATGETDYFENKRIFLLKRQGGVTTKVTRP
ncbi:MAG TPA: ABC transporter substrate-binding protein [Lacibacter sp.]|nr:ABC transporter substrate-binding protein [Lacibacter sp.]HMO89258.1 ABC transporter substrate-binding protein [Lacibacter sp.]